MSSTARQNPANVEVASGRPMRAWACTTSRAVNSPNPKWKGTPWRRKNVHSFRSGLGSHFSARRGMNAPVLGSRSSKVSRNGSNWRCEGRSTVQKRFPSLKPAETKMRRRTWAPAGGAVGDGDCALTVAARATSSASTRARDTSRLSGTKVERRIEHPHERWLPIADAASVWLLLPVWGHDTPASRGVNPYRKDTGATAPHGMEKLPHLLLAQTTTEGQ